MRVRLAQVSEFAAYDVLDVPLLVARSRKVVYVNDALLRTLGVPREELVGYVLGSDPELTRLVAPRELGASMRLLEALERGADAPRDWWVEIASAEGPVRTCVRTMKGRQEGELLFMLMDTPGSAESRRFREAMIGFAPALLRSPTEDEVLEQAIAFLREHQLYATVFHLRDGGLVHGKMNQDLEGVAAAEALYGQKLTEMVFPRAALPHLEESFATRRAVFHPDVFEIVRLMHRADVTAMLEARHPHMPAVDAPIFVEDRPWGWLALIGPNLTPSVAVTVELFVQLIGSALERARHFARAQGRLEELSRLQLELVERERLATLGQASAVVAHEVRNPLGAIINAVAVLHRDKGLRGDSAQVVRVIEEEAHRLDRLVSDLLVFARPMLVRPVPAELHDIVQRAAAALRMEQTDLHLQIHPAELPVRLLRADPDLLILAIQNLLRNAFQASPRGAEVRITVTADSERARVEVQDQGPGVPEAEAERIFAPFFTTRATGTGLGLAVVSRVAEAHQGRITVRRGRLGGAAFTLELPRA